jgi:ABC-2 type transport system permease protein
MLNITFKDLQIFFKDRGSALQLFVLPLVFIFVFSGLGNINQGEPEAAPLPVVNLDEGDAAQTLLQKIDAAGGVKTTLLAQNEAKTQLEAKEINWLLEIPADFSADVTANVPTTLRLVSHPDADDAELETVRLVIDGAAQDLLLKSQILTSLQMMAVMQSSDDPEHQAFTTETILDQAEGQFEMAEERPLITITQTRPGQQEKEAEPAPFSGPNVTVTVPGFTVLFVFLAAGATALSIYSEKKTGSFRRLLAAPLPKSQLLLGKMMPTFFIALIQVSVIFLIGMFLMPLFGLQVLTLGEDPLAVAVIVIVMALCAAGLGVVIAAFAHTEGQIGGGSAVLLWVMGALGGAFFPTFLLEGFLGQAGKAVPHYWAGKALYGVLARGQTLPDITTEIAVLLGFTLLFWLVGVWRFDFD